MTREAYKKHKDVMEWFYSQPEQETSILVRDKENDSWYAINNPSFAEKYDYLINDEYVELRKAIYEGKSIEFLDMHTNKWCESITQNPNCIFVHEVKRYRVKKEIEYPVYRKNDFMIVKFINERDYEILFIFNKEKAKSYAETNLLCHSLEIGMVVLFEDINSSQWETVLYDVKRGLYDGQPVWCWDNADVASRKVKFFNVAEHRPFSYTGYKGGINYQHYKAYEHPNDEWLINAYNELKF